jgi:hypothetical protein
VGRTVVLRPVGIGGLLRDVLRRPRNQTLHFPGAAEEPSASIPSCSATPQEQRTNGATRRDVPVTCCMCLQGMALGSSPTETPRGTPSTGRGIRRNELQSRAAFFKPQVRANTKVEASRMQRPASTLASDESNRVQRSGPGRPTSLLSLHGATSRKWAGRSPIGRHPADEPGSAKGWEAQQSCRAT